MAREAAALRGRPKRSARRKKVLPPRRRAAPTQPRASKRAGQPRTTFYAADRAEWRRWLSKHYKTERQIWLVYFRTGSGRPRVSYNDAVEEALCFGWIDSTVKKLDEKRFAQRFSPRKPGSPYSQANKERLRSLAAHGRVMPEVLPALRAFESDKFRIAADIVRALRESPAAWRNFGRFSEAYKRIRISFIEGARDRPKEFAKRLRYFVAMTEKNRMYGFGGISKYY